MSGFFDALVGILDFFINQFNYMVDILHLSITSLTYVFSFLEYVPSYFYAAIVPVITIFIVLHFLNRGN